MTAPWPPQYCWHAPGRSAGAGGNHQAWERGEMLSVPFLPNEGHPPTNLLNAKPEERGAGRLRFIAQAAGPGPSRFATNMAGRGNDIILGATAITMAAPQTARMCCCLRLVRPEEGPVPPFPLPGGRLPAVASAAAPPPGPCPQRGPRHRALLPLRPQPTPPNNPWWSWQGNWSKAWGRSGPLRCLTRRPQSPAAEKRPPPDDADPELAS